MHPPARRTPREPHGRSSRFLETRDLDSVDAAVAAVDVAFRNDVFDGHVDAGVICGRPDDLSEAFTAPDLAFAETLVVEGS